MDLGLSNKVALITGAGMGLGKAASVSLAKEGVNLILGDLQYGLVDENSKELMKKNIKAFPVQVDCYKIKSIENMINLGIEKFGRIDILVNSVGDPKPGSLLELTEEDWKKSIQLKVIGNIMATKLIYPHMKMQGGGRIVNIIGTHGIQPSPDVLTAGVTNAALMSFTKGFGREAAKYNVLVNGINPGPIDTLRMQRIYESQSKEKGISIKEAKEEFVSEVPLKRMGRPQEIGDFVAFLVSEKCTFVSGAVFNIDGGQVRTI